MTWFQHLVRQALGLEDQPRPQTQLEQRAQPDVVFDPRGAGYQAGRHLHQAMEQMRQEEQGIRRVRAVQRERHHISEHEYIDTETFVEIEEGHIYREWGY